MARYKGYSNLEIAILKNYIWCPSLILLWNYLAQEVLMHYTKKASPDLESLKIIKLIIRNIRLASGSNRIVKEHSYTTQDIDALPEGKRAGANQWSNL